MLANWTINHLRKIWRGPAVQVTVDGQTHQLGQGDPRTQLLIHDRAILARLWRQPSLVFGEAYMRGDIELRGPLIDLLAGFYLTGAALSSGAAARAINWLNVVPKSISRHKAIANARHHYDLGNDFFKLWLDPSLTYSCAYFLHEDDDLTTAQQQKVELLCRKARLKPGQKLLDIGCGWGSLLFHAAKHYGVDATGITPAREQADHIAAEARRRGMSNRVHVILGDWRDLRASFDRIISVGMFEHVGLRQYALFFRRWRGLLTDGGLSILHTIGRLKPQHDDAWINKYIFPSGYLPTLAQLASHSAQADLGIVDVENLRPHYAKTLQHWSANFTAVREQIVARHGEPFARMWWLYLQGSQAGFRWGGLQLWQVVMSKDAAAPWPLNREVNLAKAALSVSPSHTDTRMQAAQR
jgi:cyclopropane-fatty-acyl-phospholipid synthase